MGRTVVTAMLLLVLIAAGARAEEHTRITVIVHPSRQVELSADVLAQIYLRRKRFWDDGAAIVPLNLTAGSPLRETFSRAVVRESESRLAEYWNRQYFYGILPPATLASSRAVVRYVASDPNAVGYVPAGEVDDSVRAVLELP